MSSLFDSNISRLSCPNPAALRWAGESPYEIRVAHLQDLPGLADLLTASFHSQVILKGLVYPLLRFGIYEDLKQHLRSKSLHYLCLVVVDQSQRGEMSSHPEADESQRLVGTVEMSLRLPAPWQAQSSQYLYISNLAVQAKYRRQGIAQQLLHSCERVALDWGFSDLYLHVLTNNPQARQLYRKLGYHLYRTESGPSSWLFGQPQRLLLRKALQLSRTEF